ncbi:hypothetical protein ABK040_011433 [Willaertia magna]
MCTEFQQLLVDYLEAFNKHDLNAVASFLSNDLQVFVFGKLSQSGLNNILPHYKSDFEERAQVTLSNIINTTETGNTASVKVDLTLEKINTTTSIVSKMKLRVNYIFSKLSNVMIVHEIESIETL